MTGKRKIGMAVAVALAAFAAGGALFIESGYYDIGADDHHTKPVLALIEQLRDRSIEMRSRTVDVRYVMDPARIAAGARRYAALCAGCHLAPGVTQSDIRPGLYPHPPEPRAGRVAAGAARVLGGQARHQDERNARMGQDAR